MQLYNSLTNQLEEFTPLNPNVVTMYNCGPTVYDYAHIGNFRSFVFADLLRRTLEFNGYTVRQIMNITDVGHMTNDSGMEQSGEDRMEKALKTSKKDGYKGLNLTSPWEIADFFGKQFIKDHKILNCLTPENYPRASDHIPEMIEITENLLKKGIAYQADDGTYYFDISQYKDYGKLSNNTMEALVAGAGGRTDEQDTKLKKSPFDFALWKKDDKHIMKWETTLGTGYPGWHIECSAMIYKHLGASIDIHTGGEDNRFPHHECEIAQSESFTGKKFVNYWLHSKFLQLDGQKMSKSLGNLFTVQQLLDQGNHPLVIRWALFTTHFQQTLYFTTESLTIAKKNIERIVDCKNRLVGFSQQQQASSVENIAVDAQHFLQKFTSEINQNLNISGALAVVFDLVTYSNKQVSLSSEQAILLLDVLKKIDHVLAVIFDYQPIMMENLDTDLIQSLINQRLEAKKAKDFSLSDSIRKQLADMGIEIRDTKDGTEWKKR